MSVVPLGGLLGTGRLTERGDVEPASADRASGEFDTRLGFIELERVAALAAAAEHRGLLPVIVQPPRAADRGKLALVIEEAVESALERRGACAPGVGAAADLESSLGDQLYRARLIEARGLWLFLGSFEGIATLGGALDAEDSAVVRYWAEAPRTASVELFFDTANQKLQIYGPPLPLGDMIAALDLGRASLPTEPGDEPPPLVSPEIAQSSDAMEASAPPPAVILADFPPSEPVTATSATESASAPAPELASAETDTEADAVPESDPAPESELLGAAAPAFPTIPSPAPEETPLAPLAQLAQDFSDDEPGTAIDAVPAPPADPVPLVELAPETKPLVGPLHPAAATEWQAWVRELESARGPKPLAVVERMFVMSYVPLRDAALRGLAPQEVWSTLDTWATSFASSYREAFEALCVRGKRPSMVLDVPEAAHRIGRLHGARSVQLLLVDGLRFDLGLRVELGLRARLGREVALTERLLLWSALPSRTETQLELIGRGAEGLKELSRAPESEVPVARGRMARTPRRIKAGHRELLKLDVVEASLTEPGGPESTRLDALGVEVTDAVAELCEKLPPRTLLFVFGDHGFCLDPQGDGTSALRQGGSRPEEVLVPAFAWLVGGVQ